MTDMNKSIGDTPIYTAKQAKAAFDKKKTEPAFGCADCAKEAAATQKKDFGDPRGEALGRSQVSRKSVISELETMDPGIRDSIKGALESAELLKQFRDDLIDRSVSTGKFTREQAEEAVNKILEDAFSPELP